MKTIYDKLRPYLLQFLLIAFVCVVFYLVRKHYLPDVNVPLIGYILFGIFLSFFAVMSGVVEAGYWYMKMRAILVTMHGIRLLNSEHLILTLLRAPFYGSIYLVTSEAFIIGMMCLFPLLHDGFYYLTRKYIDGTYSKGFMAHSTTSTAIFTLKFGTRVAIAVAGVMVIVINYILYVL